MFSGFLIAAFFSASVFALAPLEGLIQGDVGNVAQRDPLADLFSKRFASLEEGGDAAQKFKLEEYKGLFSLGSNLVNSCDVERFYTYSDPWQEEGARRSIVATLQYVGLDVSSRAIVEYAKAFKLSDQEFENIVNNLVVNTCSENVSVFSKKLLRDNFNGMWKGKSGFEAPSFKGSPYVVKSVFDKSESFEAKEREFNFAIKNFRDFCSWDGGVDNYRMLAPYLRNPYVMSLAHNHLIRRQIEWDAEKEAAVLAPSEDSAQVACEDLICRRRDPAAFIRLFPRMVGSVSLEDDLEVLYCNHFRNASLRTADTAPSIKKWINDQTLEESKLLPMSFVSLVSGVPDLFFAIDAYEEVGSLFSSTIEQSWDEWAVAQTDTLVLDLLYEESLYVDLSPVNAYSKAQGDLALTFDFTLGELDRELKVVDKISSLFHLSFPKSYLGWARRSYIDANNRSQHKEAKEIEKRVETYINLQLEEKSEYFKLALWNENFGAIVAQELLDRVVGYKGSRFEGLEHDEVKVPVRFRFGLFALKYLRDKAKYQSKP